MVVWWYYVHKVYIHYIVCMVFMVFIKLLLHNIYEAQESIPRNEFRQPM
jgi:hypothetical protein